MNSVAETALDKTKASENYTYIFDLIELCDRMEAQNIFTKCINDKSPQQYQTRFFFNRKLIDVNLTFVNTDTSLNHSDNSIVAVARDITKEKQKEVDLLRFHNIAEGSVNPVLITDITGKMIYVNPAFMKITGYSKDELLGKNPRMFGSGKRKSLVW